jgi:hypothetical protein
MTRWLLQTTFSDVKKGTVGNCTQAAVASYMGMSLDQVPDWNNLTKDDPDAGAYWHGLHSWFRQQGYELCSKSKDWGFAGIYLVSGVSPRNPEIRHMVVYEDRKLKHDPHPDGSGIVGDPCHVWVANSP